MDVLENKIPPPIVTALIALAMWGMSLYVPTFEINNVVRLVLSVMLLVSGLFFNIAGVVSFRIAKTTINPLEIETATSLVSSGVFKISRNPMYVGFLLLLVAWAVYLSSPWVGVWPIGYVLYINRFQITPEERALTKIFGPEFVSYQAKVRRWL